MHHEMKCCGGSSPQQENNSLLNSVHFLCQSSFGSYFATHFWKYFFKYVWLQSRLLGLKKYNHTRIGMGRFASMAVLSQRTKG